MPQTMAEAIDSENFNISAITQHLQKGSFAPILEQSNEKDDHTALKLMCIVDYSTQQWGLYTRIQVAKSPKLLAQLLQFRSYGTFKYYDYQAGTEIGKRMLKCKFCQLVGSYGCILTHMAINHNAHIGLKTCAYCNRTDLKKHFADGSLEQCYANYVQRYDIEQDESIYNIITDFYDMLKGLALKFNINTYRNYGFSGKGLKAVERLGRSGGVGDGAGGYDSDVDDTIQVFKNPTPKIASKNISGRLDVLHREFQRVISNMYGGNNASRLMQQPTAAADGETIIISDDDDDNTAIANENNVTNIRTVHFSVKTESTSDEGTSTGSASTLQTPIKTEAAAEEAPPSMQNQSNGSMPTAPMVCIPHPQANGPSPTQMEKRKSESDPFLQLVEQRLNQTPEAEKRRKLQNAILKAMVQIDDE